MVNIILVSKTQRIPGLRSEEQINTQDSIPGKIASVYTETPHSD
jgi:hypothetical protein